MTDKEGFFERMQREEREARLNAGIAELKRRFAVGEFPENDDTINAFSAGFYATYEFQQERREAAGGGENMRMLTLITAVLGLMMVGFYGMFLAYQLPMNDGSWLMPIIGVVLCGVAVWSGRRSRNQWREAQAAYKEKWG